MPVFTAAAAADAGAAGTTTCASPWPSAKVSFEAKIGYLNLETKASPFVTVEIDGQPRRLLLDTGTNLNVLWDTSLSGKAASGPKRIVQTEVAQTQSTQASHRMSDGLHEAFDSLFHWIPPSILADDGLSGILSPQVTAHEIAGSRRSFAVLDFDRDCFFVSPAFDIDDTPAYRLARGRGIPNPHRVMATSLGLYDAKIPVTVDSGAEQSNLLRTLVSALPKVTATTRIADLWGNVLTNKTYMRRVSFTLNGIEHRNVLVAEADAVQEGGSTTLGTIGMDILRNRVVILSSDTREFYLLVPVRKL
ncbi:hypothetical protein PIN31009_02903 [Pandoraea iniqua]|uniref:hypothetical protein n=1 Tax=Pandoraea iniqua TaxID=2508288 RepID=UPI00124288B3|nr:hypothetical protein [Pandoraea iniqua]VVE16436.1 hypothetical protein PIN31009_02903 [Pandoraea iniqua]